MKTLEEKIIYVSPGTGLDFGLKGKNAAKNCLCFSTVKYWDSKKAPSLKYFHTEAIKKCRKGKRLFLFSDDIGYREFYKEHGDLWA
jgi:hypothetical protein